MLMWRGRGVGIGSRLRRSEISSHLCLWCSSGVAEKQQNIEKPQNIEKSGCLAYSSGDGPTCTCQLREVWRERLCTHMIPVCTQTHRLFSHVCGLFTAT